MNLLIRHLVEDHKHFVGVLYHLEREIKAYGGLLRTSANMDTILDIFDYIKVYPQMWHHPTEDIIYEILLSKDIPDPDAVADLMEEHGVLDMLTEYLHQVFNAIARGEQVSIVRLVKRTNEFIQRQLKHIRQEQTVFFPLAEQYLSEADWEDVNNRLQGKVNACGGIRWQEYKSLYRNIVGGSALTAH